MHPQSTRLSTRLPPLALLGPLAILLLAAALRLYRLDYQPLWWDEGLSLFFAKLDFWSIIQAAGPSADVNPPLYRLLLGSWLRLAGWSVFATRFFSVAPGLVLTALVYRIARQWRTSKMIAMAAMFLCATSPVLIYYSQEAKGYMLVAMAGAASVALWSRLDQNAPHASGPRAWRWWGLWGVTVLMAIGSHYLAVFLILTENLWTLGRMVKAHGQLRREWLSHWLWQLGAQAVVAGAILLFIIPTFGSTSFILNRYGAGGQRLAETFLSQHFLEMVMGPGARGPGAWLASVCLWALAVAGAFASTSKRGWLIGWLGIPWLGGVAFHLYRDFFSARFLLYSVPALLLLAAHGLAALAALKFKRPRGWAMGLGCAACLLVGGPTLVELYTAPRWTQDDYRPLIAQVRALARPGDALLAGYTWQDGYFSSYAPDAPVTFYRKTYEAQTVNPWLETIFSAHPRVWIVNYQADVHDLSDPFNRWLHENTALAFEQWYGTTQLALAVPMREPPGLWPEQTLFEGTLQLEYVPVIASVRPGDILSFYLRWSATVHPTQPYKVFVHLGPPDGAPIAQADSQPADWVVPSESGGAGLSAIERHAFVVPLDSPPGEYSLYVGLYDPADNRRYKITASSGSYNLDRAQIGLVQILNP